MRLWLAIAAILLSCATSASTPITTQPAPFSTTQPATLESLQKQIQLLEIRIMILELDQKFLKDYLKTLIEIITEKKYHVYESDNQARI